MFRKNKTNTTSIRHNDSVEGETIEMKIERIVNNQEPINDGAPIVYTERKDGVLPQFDIRTDRFEVAVEAMDKVSKTHLAKRDGRVKERESISLKDSKKDGGAEPTQGTE